MLRGFRYSTFRRQLLLLLLLITFNFSFAQTTIFQPTDVPASLNETDPSGTIEVGLKFRSTVNGSITAIRFYKAASNIGTHIGHLWSTANTTTPLSTITFTGETTSGWQQMSLSSPIGITAGQTYIASYFSSAGHYSETGFFFSGGPVINGPLRALGNGEDGPNAVYKSPATATPATYPNLTFVGDNYWVDVVFVSSDIAPPVVTSVTPVTGSTNVSINSTVTAIFNEPLDAATVTSSTFELRNASNTLIPATVSYNAGTQTATLTPSSPLSYLSTYTATLKGGATGSRIKDVASNALAADYSWTFTTQFAPPLSPNNGPGGPILVISTTTNPFSRFPVEMLRAEGLNEFAAADISTIVNAASLSSYDVVVLGEMTVSAPQVTLLTNWVNAGGTLIAFRPSSNLNSLLGLNATTGTLADKYLLVSTTSGPGLGIVNQTMQFHGTADLHTLTGGATSLATLYSDATTATTNPAVTTRTSGSGKAIAFTYDLPKSIIYTRQGNPAQAGVETDGQTPIRSDDQFFPSYLDMNKVQIPQADEQQRLLANIIIQSNLAKKPLPRLWYMPGTNKAAIVYTVDDHGTASGTEDVFNKLLANSPVGGSVANWTAYRATSWLYVGIPLTDSEAGAYYAQGFEMGVHVENGCANFTSFANLDASYTPQLLSFQTNYPSLPAQTTHRFHCIVWSDWLTQAKVELSHGIRYSMDYYYWPPAWINNRPGLFTGSGMPMRFGDVNGDLIDVYQGVSQLVNENGVDYNLGVNTLLDNALGSKGYYGFFGTHDDYRDTTFSTAVIAAAKSRNVPIISAKQALTWVDGRNNSSIGSITWSSNQLSFSVIAYTGADNLKTMLPMYSSNGQLTSITRNGSAVTFTTQTIKGIQYAFFDAPVGNNNFVATYAVDATPPVISAILATPNADGVSATITWTTTEGSDSRVDYGTVSSNLNLNVSDNNPVSSHSVVLTGLTAGTMYHFRVTSKDVIGNSTTEPALNNSPLNFTMPTVCASDVVAADFSLGSHSANTITALDGDGGVILKPTLVQEFSGSTVPSGWTSAAFNPGSTTVSGGSVTVNGTHVYTNTSFGPGTSIEFVATFNSGIFQGVGLTSDQAFNNSPWVVIGQTGAADGNLYARGSDGTAINIGTTLLGSSHRYRINWNATNFQIYVDGSATPAATINMTVSSNMFIQISDVENSDGTLSVDWVRAVPYALSGPFNSRVFDAGSSKMWGAVNWNSDVPANTSLNIFVRTGNTPSPDGTWTGYTQINASGNTVGATSRYIQYRANLATTDVNYTPILKDISISCSAPVSAPAVTTQPSAQTICAGNNVSFTSAASGTPTPIVQWQVSTNGTTWTNISGAVNGTLTFATTIADNSKQYRAVWTNSVGSVNSNAVVLTVNAVPAAPTVTVTNNCGSSLLTASNFTGTLLWSNSATTTSITVTNAATYTVTQAVSGCTSAAGSGVSAPKTVPTAPTVTVTNNCGSSLLTASNFTGSLLWSNGASTTSITVTDAATYTVTQTVNGCVSANGSGVSAPKAVPSAPTVTVTNNCGSSLLTASNFTGSLLWSNAATTTSITVTDAATYNVTQTAANGCISANGSGVSAPKVVPATPTVTVTNNCGSSLLTAGNITESSLLWSNAATTTSITITNAATYTVTQTGVNGCTSVAGSGVSAPKVVPATPTVNVTNNCGSSLLTAGNITESSLLWSNAATTTSITVTDAATYTVTQTGVNGCTSAAGSGVSAPKVVPATPTVNVTNNCGSSLLTAGNITESSLLWSNAATTTSITVTNAATYTVTQTGVNGCTSAAGSGVSVPKVVPATPTVNVTNNCGSSLLTAGNITESSLLWSNAATTTSITVIDAATYTVTQTGINGCTSAAGSGVSAPKVVPSAPTVTVTNNCGSSLLTASNFTGSLLWSNAATTTSITVTDAATYTVTQTTANGCVSAAGSGISAPKAVPTAPTVTVTNNCGNSLLTASNFTGSLLWSNAATTSSITVTNAATYTVTQTAANGCISAVGSGVSAPKVVPATPTVNVTNNCGSSLLNAGNITETALLWSNAATTTSITVTNAATYTVTQTGLNGCTSAAGSGVSAPKVVPATPTVNVTNNCGSTLLTAGNITETSLLWSNAATTTSITVTDAATYTVTQTGLNGCTSPAGSGVSAPKAVPTAPTVNVVDNCGSSLLTASNFTGSLLWSNAATTSSITVTNAATYTVTQTAANGCVSAAGSGVPAPKTVPSAPTVTVTNNCGSSLLTASNFTGSLLWSNSATTSSITVTDAATYTVTQTTANGCISTNGSGTSAPKAVPTVPTVTVTNNCGNSLLTASNFTGSLLWSNGATTSSITVTNAATYTVTQTTANGCVSSAGSGVSAPKVVPSAPTVAVVNNCGNAVLTASNYTGSLLWSNALTTPSITVSNTAAYTVTQTTANGCTSATGTAMSHPRTIPGVPVITVRGPSTFCQGGSVVLISNAKTRNLWSTGATTQSIVVAATDAYSVTYTNDDGCSTVSNPSFITVNQIPAAPTVSVANNCGNSVLTAGNFTGSLLWNNGATTSAITVMNANTYTVTQTVNGCVSPATSSFSSPKVIPGTPTVSVSDNCGNSVLTAGSYAGSLLWSNGSVNPSITVTNAATYSVSQTINGCTSNTVSGISAPKTVPTAPTVAVVNNCGNSLLTASNYTGSLLWSDAAQTTASITVNSGGTYTVTQTTANGCTSTTGSGIASPKTIPSAPVVTVNNNCGNSLLTASNFGGTLLWSEEGLSTPSITVTSPGIRTVTQTMPNGCTSSPASGMASPMTIPSAPTVSVSDNCGNSILTASNFTGSLLWSNGKTTSNDTVTTGGTYTVTQTAANGCTSAAGSGIASPKTIPTAPAITPMGPTTFCQGGNVMLLSSSSTGNTWSTGATTQSILVNASGNYTVTVTAGNGCTSANSAATAITVNPITFSTTNLTICSDQLPYTWNTHTYTGAGTYNVTLANHFGCDSMAVLILAVKDTAVSTTNVTICSSQLPYHWNNNFYAQAGTYKVDGFTNIVGCDSSAVLVLTVKAVTSSTATVAVCQNQLPYHWSGTDYFAAGDYVITGLTNAAGCDSTATLHLTVKQTSTSDTAVTTCNSYLWNGTLYTVSGTYNKLFVGGNASGCDSTATLHLVINHSTTSDTTAIACNNFLWHGTTYTTSGNYTYSTTNAAGCDSVRTLHLTINVSTTSDTTAVACNSYDWHGTTYTTSGNYTYITTNAAGCDSVRTLHLTINHSTTSDTTAVACNSYDWHGTTYTTSGNYTYTTTNAAGCDSVRTLHLTINVSTTSDTTAVACNSYDWHGTTYTTSGNYTYTTINAAGCDSVRTLHLTINVSTTSDTTAVACNSYDWHGTTYTTSGNYTYTTTNAAGCDSVRTLHLTINHSTISDTTAVACNSYDWHGTTYTTSGNYTYTTTNAAGCDSVRTLHLTINVSTTSDTTAVACNSYDWHGTTYTTSGNYTYTTTNAAGCDSIRTLHLTINISTTSDTTAVACNSYDWHGTTYTTSGNYTYTTTNAAGCDSVRTLHLTINTSPVAPTISLTEGLATFCAPGSAILSSDAADGNKWYKNSVLINGENGISYTATTSGVYTATYTNAGGCESPPSISITITVNTTPVVAPITGSTAMAVGLTTQLANATAGGIWSSENAAIASVDENGLVTGVAEGTTTIHYAVSNGCGTTTVDATVTVTAAGRIITPRGSQGSSNLPSMGQPKLDITAMPNPAASYFNLIIKSSDAKVVAVRVFDPFGKPIANYQKIAPGTVLKLGQGWSSGVYLVEVVQGNERKTIKVMITN